MIGEVFKRTFSHKFFSKYPYLLIPLILNAIIIHSVALFLYYPSFFYPKFTKETIPHLFIFIAVALVVGAYFRIVLIEMCRQIIEEGKVGIARAFTSKARRITSLLGAMLLLGLILVPIALLPIALIIIMISGLSTDDYSSTALAALCGASVISIILLILILYLLIRFILYEYAIVIDGARAVESLRRSWHLTRGYWWKLFAIFLIFAALILLFVLPMSMFPRDPLYQILSVALIFFMAPVFAYVIAEAYMILRSAGQSRIYKE